MIKKILLSFVIFNLSFVISASADINGYYENYVLGVAQRDGSLGAGDFNRLRLKIDFGELHLEPQYAVFPKTESIPLSGISNLDQLVWDRVYLKHAFPLADVTIGKQRIAWGTCYIWNPTDAFNPYTLSFAVSEDQESAPQAVRLEVPFGALSGVDAFVLTNYEWSKSKKGLRVKTNYKNSDFSFSYVDNGDEGFQLGFDLAGELFELGVRSEIALIAPASSDRYFQSVWGWNYTFENGWGVDMEYFNNGLGKRNKDNYDWSGLLAGNISQLAADYFYFGVNKNLDEITSFRKSIILNADDLSFMAYPSYFRNVAQNVDVELAALLQFGQLGTEFKPTSAEDTTGLLGSNIGFLKIKYSF